MGTRPALRQQGKTTRCFPYEPLAVTASGRVLATSPRRGLRWPMKRVSPGRCGSDFIGLTEERICSVDEQRDIDSDSFNLEGCTWGSEKGDARLRP
jgi:hypothetical protein